MVRYKKWSLEVFKTFNLQPRRSEVNLDKIESNLGYYLPEVLKSEEKKFEKEKFPEKQDQSFQRVVKIEDPGLKDLNKSIKEEKSGYKMIPKIIRYQTIRKKRK